MADSPPPTTRSSRAIKPRANVQRKAKADTQKFLAEEAERSKFRTDSQKTRATGTRGGRGRGRGGINTADTNEIDRNSRLRDVETGGVFGAGTGQKPKPGQRRGSSAGFTEAIDADGNLVQKTEPEPAVEKPKARRASKGKEIVTATEDIGAQGSADASAPMKPVTSVETVISDDDEPDEERRDIERIWLSSDEDRDQDLDEKDDDEDVVDHKGKRKNIRRPRLGGGSGLRPVRAPRTLQYVADDEDASAKARRLGKTDSKSRAQDTIDVDEMDVDEVEFLKDVPSSPEMRRKILKKASAKGKDVRLATETLEERAERLRTAEDISKLRHIFAPGGSAAAEGQKGKTKDDGEERLFILQFPPITPFLIDPSAPPDPIDDDEVMEVKQEGTTTAASANAQQPTSPTSKAAVKKDLETAPTTKAAARVQSSVDGVLTASSSQRLPAGLVGKLNVHASGKITLDWGGCDMEVRLGTDVGFLQDAVLVQPPGEEGREQGNEEMGDEEARTVGKEKEDEGMGTVYALGQVQGKLVVVPDWARLYD